MTFNDCTKLFGTGNYFKDRKKEYSLVSDIPASSFVSVFEDRHFAFASFQEAADIFLVRKQYQQSHRNGKYSVEGIVHIKDDQDENRKCNTGQYGTE